MKSRWLIASLAVILIAGGAAFAIVRWLTRPATDDAIKLVPADSILYGNIFLDPSNGQKRALENLIAETPFETPDRVKEEIRKLFDRDLEQQGCSFEEDVEPWLGKQIGGFITEFGIESDGAVLIASEDDDQALESFEKCSEEDVDDFEERSYEGVDYRVSEADETYGIVEGYLVLGTEDSFKDVVDTSSGEESLEDSERFDDAVKALPDDRLAFMYFDLKEALQSVPEAAQLGAVPGFTNLISDQPMTLSLSARSEGLALDITTGLPPDPDLAATAEQSLAPEVLEDLPEDSWGAFAIGSFSDYAESLLDSFSGFGLPGFNRELLERRFQQETGLSLTQDLLSWMGDLGFFVRGTTPTTIGGGAVIETTDPAASKRAVDAVAEVFARQGAPLRALTVPGATGFAIQDRFTPEPINIAVGDDRVVIAYGNESTIQGLRSDTKLGDAEAYQEAEKALGADFEVSGFVDIEPIVELVEAFMAEPDPEYEEDVKPFLDAMNFFVFGGKVEGDTQVSRFLLGVG